MTDNLEMPRTSLRDHVRERILRRILDGTYGPGDRIVENRLMKEFGVSQAPIREALRELETLRFVTSQAHRGVRVRSLSRTELGEMYPVRAALEEVAGRAAAPEMSDETLRLLEVEITAMRDAAARRDVHSQLRHDARFHELIVTAAQNSLLLELWKSLHVETRTLITISRIDADLVSVADTHVSIMQALSLRDPELVGKEMRDHIEHFGAWVMQNVDESDPDPTTLRTTRGGQK